MACFVRENDGTVMRPMAERLVSMVMVVRFIVCVTPTAVLKPWKRHTFYISPLSVRTEHPLTRQYNLGQKLKWLRINRLLQEASMQHWTTLPWVCCKPLAVWRMGQNLGHYIFLQQDCVEAQIRKVKADSVEFKEKRFWKSLRPLSLFEFVQVINPKVIKFSY